MKVAPLHIWYIHHYAGGPSLGAHHRPYELAQAWQRQGHTATIFVAGFHHLLEPQAVLAPNFEINGANYVTIPARRYSGNGVGRILNLWDFSSGLHAVGRKYGKQEPRPDVVVVSSPHPFSIFGGHALAQRYRAKLIFEIRDIWPLSLTEILSISSLHPFVQMCAYAERYALKNADIIASVLPRANHYLADRGYSHKPFLWVPNGVSSQEVKDQSPLSHGTSATLEKLFQWKKEGCTTVVHAGSLGQPNAVDLLLEAILVGVSRGLANKCRVLLVGKGEQMSALKEFAAARNLTNVHFVGHVAKGEVSQILDACDIAYAGVRSFDRLYRYGVSLNKFSDYFSASLAVILPIAPCGDPVSESGGGIARQMKTPEAIWNALYELMLMTPQERYATGAKGKAYMAREYDYSVIAKRYVEAVMKLPTVR